MMGSLKEAVQKRSKAASEPVGPSRPLKKSRKEIPSQVLRSTQLPSPPQVPSSLPSSSPPSIEVITVAASPLADDGVVVVEAPARSTEAVQALSTQARPKGSWVASWEATDEGADKGKTPMLSHFTAEYGPNIPSEELTIAIGMLFKATD